MIAAAARPRHRTASSSSSRATTAICCSTSLPLGIPVLGIEPAANVAKVAIDKGIPTRVDFFGVELAETAGRRRPEGRSHRRQQRPGPGARPQRLRRRHGPAAEAGGRHHARVPAPRAADGGEPVRHHLPRALLVLLARRRSSIWRAGHGLKADRCRGALRPTAARCGSISRMRGSSPGRTAARRGAARARGAPSGFCDLATYASFAEQVQTHQAQAAVVPDRGQGRGQDDLRLRRAGQGQHAAQLLRHRHRLPRLHRRPQSLQARPLHARHAHPDPAGRGDRRRQSPTTSSSCRGT